MATPERLRAERQGRRAEAVAALWLRAQLFAIVAQRFKTPVGEIDLVARRGRLLVFVEVKARTRATSEAEALEAVNRQRIVHAANWYIARHPHLAGLDMRFDVMFLAPGALPRHLKHAFTA